ncbi:MAG TPA: folylpolyglutamate synthase/dihydrofolate synthase family protein [Bacteroidales bacterium]|nr:folylpolyglutamate synthase/dihydrofolate synthase family protein [Bacteroidales bacterium]
MVRKEYQETLDFMYSQLPMFHRIGKAAYKANLDNAHALDSLCGFPHRKYKTIHIAGTNGKGSVSHMLASVLQQAGYKTGLFTSPHLVDFRERIRLNGEMIPEEAVVAFVNKYKRQFEEIKPSFFEMTSAMAFEYFASVGADIAVIETGLGGRLDSTNIIVPELSVITNISFDHMELLGDTLAKIAAEKAGIIKPRVAVVVGEVTAETSAVFGSVAKDKDAPLFYAENIYTATSLGFDQHFQRLRVDGAKTGQSEIYRLDLKGLYQKKNICTVLAAIDILNSKNVNIRPEDVKAGLLSASANTGLKGRWQVLAENPLMICDTGHNEDGIRWVVQQLMEVPHDKLHIVFGVVKDKDVTHMLPLLPTDAEYYFTRANIPRALDENELKRMANAAGLRGESYPAVDAAIKFAKKNAKSNDLIFIGGSTFIVADALQNARFS